MLKEIFHDSFENLEITRICKLDWMAIVVFLIQMLPTFGGRCNAIFEIYGRKCSGYLIRMRLIFSSC